MLCIVKRKKDFHNNNQLFSDPNNNTKLIFIPIRGRVPSARFDFFIFEEKSNTHTRTTATTGITTNMHSRLYICVSEIQGGEKENERQQRK
jgi:hypothetical protein